MQKETERRTSNIAEWLQYCWRWLRLAFSRPWNIASTVAGIIALGGGLVVWKVPKWSSLMTNLVWQIPLGLLVLLTAARLTIAPFKIYKDQKTTIADLEGKLEQQRKSFAMPEQLVGPTLNNLDIKVGDLTRADDFIRSKVFNKCHIHGPAVLLPQGGNTLFTKCIFGGQTEHFLITTTNKRVFGVINVYDCIFKECEFHHIGIIGNAETIKKVRGQIQPLPSQKEKPQ